MPETKETGVEFVPLAYFSNFAEAGMARELLTGNGINAVLKGANFGGLEPLPLVGGFSEIQLLVPAAEFDQAQSLYQAFFDNEGESLPAEKEVDEAGNGSTETGGQGANEDD